LTLALRALAFFENTSAIIGPALRDAAGNTVMPACAR
jgi:hypothetical protein